MPTSLIRFVDQISGAPTTRLDLTAAPWRVRKDDTVTPPPPMRRQSTGNMLTDGATITSSAYENRELRLGLTLKASTAEVAAQQMQALHRELDRQRNVLWWQPDTATPPVFFRTYRAPDYVPDSDWGTGIHNFQLVIPAEPFAYGVRETIGPFTVYHDPAAASNPCYFDVTSIKGDCDTPLHMSVNDAGFRSATIVIATRRRGTPGNMTWLKQAEAAGVGTDTTVQANDLAFSGAGSNWTRTTFASGTTMATRLTFTVPATGTGSVDWRGTYRVLARMRRSAGSDPVNVHVRFVGAVAPAVSVPLASTALVTYDLGLIQLPAFSAGDVDGYGAQMPVAPVNLELRAERTSGATSSLDIDYVLLVPADQELAVVRTPTSDVVVFDGPNRAIYKTNAAGELAELAGDGVRMDGSLPMLTPGTQTNRVFVVNGLGSVPALAASAVFTAAYWPRYLYVRPAGS